MRKITAFYAWQSDTPERFNRHLIRIALEAAAKRITDSTPDVELIVDYDTLGVPGTPPITDTILKKIAGCDIFIPDVTFVARTAGGKLIPNPNVMTEYGYALCAKTYVAMMPLMNTAFGAPQDLPFDMGHLRHPIQYCVEPTAKPGQRRAVRELLSQEFEEKLRLQIAATQPAPPSPAAFPEANPSYNQAVYFEPNEVLANSSYPSEQEWHLLDGDRLVYLRLFPTHAGQPSVGLAKLTNVFDTRKPCPMSTTIGGVPGRNRFGPVIYDPQGPNTMLGLTQGFPMGELWGVNAQAFSFGGQHNVFRRDIWVASVIGLEKLYVRVLRNYVKVASSELGLIPPYTVEMGAVGINGAYLAVPGGSLNTGQLVGPIMTPYIQKRYSIPDISDNEIMGVLRSYFLDFYDLATCTRAEVLTDQLIATHDLPPR